jgi:amidophosphoribosyltransferase
MGRRLAREVSGEGCSFGGDPDAANFVAYLPDSGTTAAIGYAEESGIPFEAAVVRNRYVGRTFIQPTQRVRELGVRIKLSPSQELFADSSAILVDDSLVRGTTAGLVVAMVRECRARELHLRISSPPVKYPCYYGIDTPSRGDLTAAEHSIAEIATSIGADSLRYLSKDGLIGAIGLPGDKLCTACFDGRYLEDPTEAASSGCLACACGSIS